jgi:hypothetical protein
MFVILQSLFQPILRVSQLIRSGSARIPITALSRSLIGQPFWRETSKTPLASLRPRALSHSLHLGPPEDQLRYF